jgi:hypothetical protein
VRADIPSRTLLGGNRRVPRWSDRYAVRLAIALHPRRPVALALGQLSA